MTLENGEYDPDFVPNLMKNPSVAKYFDLLRTLLIEETRLNGKVTQERHVEIIRKVRELMQEDTKEEQSKPIPLEELEDCDMPEILSVKKQEPPVEVSLSERTTDIIEDICNYWALPPSYLEELKTILDIMESEIAKYENVKSDMSPGPWSYNGYSTIFSEDPEFKKQTALLYNEYVCKKNSNSLTEEENKRINREMHRFENAVCYVPCITGDIAEYHHVANAIGIEHMFNSGIEKISKDLLMLVRILLTKLEHRVEIKNK